MSNYHPDQVGAVTDTGPVREANEDRFMTPATSEATALGAVYIVADGVGGQKDGDVAAEIAVRTVHDAFYQARRGGSDVPTALQYAVEQANQAVYQEARARGMQQMGCTLVAAVPFQGQLYVVHVGDARAYLAESGHLRPLTRDHSWVQEQVDAQVLTPAEAAQHEFRNVITRTVGNALTIDVEHSGPFALHGHQVLLLCSDGLHDIVKEKQLHQILMSSPSGAAAHNLVRAAVQRGASDNITAVVVGLSPRVNPITGFLTRKLGQRVPVWMPIVAVGAFLFILLLMARSAQPTSSSEEVETILGSEITTGEGPTDVPPPIVMPTSTPLQRPPTQTPAPTATPKTLGFAATQNVFVFENWQLEERCYNPAARNTSMELEFNERVYILSDYTKPRSVLERAKNGQCVTVELIQVQSVGRPDVVGWVLQAGIQPISAGSPP